MKTIKFWTLGCKVNQYDTQVIREQFIRAGFKELDNGLPADIYVINTCTVTHRADKDSLKFIRKAEKENPCADIIVTGCLAELDEAKIRNSNSKIILVQNKDKENILPYINPLFVQAKYKQDSKHDCAGISYFTGHTRAFLKIQDGCDNFCSYCKVPYVRGRPRSKAISEIVIEAEKLVKNGFKEVVLCGVCLGAYGKDLGPKWDLVSVIKRLEEIGGLLRIRLSSIEPKDVNDALIEKLQNSDKLCPHLHIPLQSGDDDVLKAMNRNYARTEYLNLVNKIRKFIPDIAITTDVLVGFPCESERNFQNTVSLIKEIIPLRTHIFSYSRRQISAAAEYFKKDLAPKVVRGRTAYLKTISHECSLSYRQRFLNKEVLVLVESRTKENPHLWQGHTDNYIKVLINPNFAIAKFAGRADRLNPNGFKRVRRGNHGRNPIAKSGIKESADFKNKLINIRLTKLTYDGMSGEKNA